MTPMSSSLASVTLLGKDASKPMLDKRIAVCKSHWVLNTFNLIAFLISATTNNRSSSQKPKLNFWLHQILNLAALPAHPSSSFSLQQPRLKLIGNDQTRSLRHSSPWSWGPEDTPWMKSGYQSNCQLYGGYQIWPPARQYHHITTGSWSVYLTHGLQLGPDVRLKVLHWQFLLPTRPVPMPPLRMKGNC